MRGPFSHRVAGPPTKSVCRSIYRSPLPLAVYLVKKLTILQISGTKAAVSRVGRAFCGPQQALGNVPIIVLAKLGPPALTPRQSYTQYSYLMASCVLGRCRYIILVMTQATPIDQIGPLSRGSPSPRSGEATPYGNFSRRTSGWNAAGGQKTGRPAWRQCDPDPRGARRARTDRRGPAMPQSRGAGKTIWAGPTPRDLSHPEHSGRRGRSLRLRPSEWRKARPDAGPACRSDRPIGECHKFLDPGGRIHRRPVAQPDCRTLWQCEAGRPKFAATRRSPKACEKSVPVGRSCSGRRSQTTCRSSVPCWPATRKQPRRPLRGISTTSTDLFRKRSFPATKSPQKNPLRSHTTE